MITHHLHSAWRHYVRYKYSTIANVLCLAFGIACFLCAYSVFAVFQSSESGFSQSHRIYTIKTQVISSHGSSTWFAGIPYRMIKYLKSDFTDAEAISLGSSVIGSPAINVTLDNGRKERTTITKADPQFFKLFDIHFLRGDRESALATPNGVVLGKAVALKIFDSVDVIGRTFTIDGNIAVSVTGVMDALPVPSHLTNNRAKNEDGNYYLDVVASEQVLSALSQSPETKPSQTDAIEDSRNNDPNPNRLVYLLLPEHRLDIDSLNAKLQAIVDRSIMERPMLANGEKISYKVQAIPIKELLSLTVGIWSNVFGLPLLSMVVFFGTAILLVAILNYINIATTQAIANQTELGIQRLLGASRKQMAIQSGIETLLLCSSAASLGIVIFASMQTYVVRYSRGFVDFQASWLGGWRFTLAATVSVLVVTLFAALYPMIKVASTTPNESVRSNTGRIPARVITQLLVATQFAIAGTLLFVMMAIQQQAAELMRTAIGNLKDPLVFIKQPGGPPKTLEQAGVDFKTLAAQLLQHKQVKQVAMADRSLWAARAFITVTPTGISTTEDNGAQKIMVGSRRVTSNYFAAMNVDLLAGKTFDRTVDEANSKSAYPENVIPPPQQATQVVLSQSVADALGYKNPQQLIGTELYDHRSGKAERMIVIGVAANHFAGYDGAHNAGTVYFSSDGKGQAIIQIDKNDTKAALEIINQTWKSLSPNTPIELQFADAAYGSWLTLYSNLTDPLTFLMIVAIAVSVIGMIAISAHTLRRRTREISIRKSLGASSRDVFQLLLKDFSIPVIIAVALVAWPIGWMLSREFISWFPYRATLGPWPFITSLLGTVLVAWLAVSLQSLKAARRKPAEVLRHD
jgi:putative ABC transport system permease protein